MTASKMIDCDKHGAQPWTGQVMCEGCGAVWHLNVENPPTADGSCTCGRPLVTMLVDARLREPRNFGSGKAICPSCYRTLRAQQAAGAGGS